MTGERETASLDFSCACGAVRGRLVGVRPGGATRCICHCRWCTGYAEALAATARFAEQGGGTDVAQIAPDALRFDAGHDRVVSLRQSPRGALRWHAHCCDTPPYNTLGSLQTPFVGLLLGNVAVPTAERDTHFGPVATRLNLPPGSPHRMRILGLLGMLWRLSWLMLGWRRRRACTAQFDPASLRPLTPPRPMTPEERGRLDASLAALGGHAERVRR